MLQQVKAVDVAQAIRGNGVVEKKDGP